MSPRAHSTKAAGRRFHAAVFAALGDETRLALVAKLSERSPQSISELTGGSKLTRQAISKHLRVLEDAGVVRAERSGRESLYEFRPERIDDLRTYLGAVSREWDDALGRLTAFVEG